MCWMLGETPKWTYVLRVGINSEKPMRWSETRDMETAGHS